MKNNSKTVKDVSVGQILSQFWNGIRPAKGLFFTAYIFFFVAQLINLFIPLYYKKFFDVISKSIDSGSTAPLLIQIVTTILIFHACNWLFWRIGMNLFNTVESKIMARLKQNAFNYTIKHSYTFFANNFSGSLVQKVGRFSRAFESLADSLAFNLMPLVITVVGSIWITWFIAPMVSIIIGIWVIAITVFSIIFSTWKLKYDTAVAEADSRTTGYLADSVTNNTAVSFFTGHDYESKGFKEVSNDQAKKVLFSWRLGDVVDAFQTILIILVEFFVFYYAIKYWKLGVITVGTFVLAQTYIIGLSQQLWGLNKIIRSIYQSLADSKQMAEILLTDYEIKDINGDIIYSGLELRPQTYYVDKEAKTIIGLRHGIKLMRKNEKVTFLFPSHMAYGYHGDNKRIGTNEPLICTVTLNDFKPDPNQNKKQSIIKTELL